MKKGEKDIRAKLMARQPQNPQNPKVKRPAALAANSAFAPLKRQKLDHQQVASQAQQPKQQKLAIPITVPITSNQQQQKSSTSLPAIQATNVPSSSHSNPNQFGSQQKITSSLTADADKKREQQPQQQPTKFNHIESTAKTLPELQLTSREQSQNDLTQNKILNEIKFLADAGESKEIEMRGKLSAVSNETEFKELLNKMSADEIIKLLHSFALSPSIYSRIVEFVWSKDEYHIFVETANTLLPFLRAYKLKGANNLDQFIACISAQDQLAIEEEQKQGQDITSSSSVKIPCLWRITTDTTFSASRQNTISHFSEIADKKTTENNDGILMDAEDSIQNISVDNMLKLLCACPTNEKSERELHQIFKRYCLHRPDILEHNSLNLSEQIKLIFSSRSHFSQKLLEIIIHQSSSLLIRQILDQILCNFDSSLSPSNIVNFVISYNLVPSIKQTWLDIQKCLTLASYIIEEAAQNPENFGDTRLQLRLSDFVQIISPLMKNSPQDFHRFYRQLELESQKVVLSNGGTNIELLRKNYAYSQLCAKLSQKFQSIPKNSFFLGISTAAAGRSSSQLDINQADKILSISLTECFELIKTHGNRDVATVVEKMQNLVKLAKANKLLITRQMPLLASKTEDLIQNNLIGRELRGSPAISLLLYLLDMLINIMGVQAPRHIWLKNAQENNTHKIYAQSMMAVLKAVLGGVFQNRKNRLQLPFLVEKTIQATVLFIKDNPGFIQDLLVDNAVQIKEMLERQPHILSIQDRDILKRELTKLNPVE